MYGVEIKRIKLNREYYVISTRDMVYYQRINLLNADENPLSDLEVVIIKLCETVLGEDK